jgi:heme/copper-type cytochrome/quinol oxidase subunit 3
MAATVLASAAVVMLFAGLLGTYVILREQAGGFTRAWVPEAASIPLVPANMALITLLMSSVTVQWAVYAIRRDDRRNAYLAMGLTVLFGVAYINAMAFWIGQLGVGIANSAYSLIVYATLGGHLALTIAALLFAGLTTFRALAGRVTPRHHESLAACTLFWHLTVLLAVAVVSVVVWFK